jgi:N-acetylglucosamine-6-phosphate deacetylase
VSDLHLRGRDPDSGRPVEVRVADGLIDSIHEAAEVGDEWLAAGLVDLQVNGYAGADVNAADIDASVIAELVRRVRQVGVTTVVPTVITASEERIVAALRAVAVARAADPAVAHAIPYVQVEGPFLSEQDGPRGAHDLAQIRPADVDELERWQRACAGLVGMVTISPHSERALEFIAHASRRAVVCAVGHTHASPEQIVRAADAGARLSTHLGNGAHAMLPRHPNYLWAQLAEDRLAAGLIADGHHLSTETLRAMLRAKGLSRSHLVSDASSLAGLPPGRYATPVGRDVEVTEDGRIQLVGTPLLAGAARSLADGIAIAIDAARISLAEGIGLATVNPGRFTGGRGRLRVGDPADVITFRWGPGERTLDLRRVVAAGKVVHAAA